MVAFRLFLFGEAAAEVIAELTLIERAIRCVIRDFTHALAIYRHRLVRLLGHTEHLAHLGGRRSRTAEARVRQAA